MINTEVTVLLQRELARLQTQVKNIETALRAINGGRATREPKKHTAFSAERRAAISRRMTAMWKTKRRKSK